MKRALTVLCAAVLVTGCAPMSPHQLVKEMAKDRAVFTGSIASVYGTVKFTRVGETTNKVTITSDGTITINK